MLYYLAGYFENLGGFLKIGYQKFLFSLEAKDIILLPSYKGSTLRGGFGNAFKKIVCALRKTECAGCILKEKCVYSYVFETPPPSDTRMMTKYTNAPHPFIIEPPPEKRHAYKPGDTITFGLTLIGCAIDYLPYFIYTFDELGKIGIGKDRGRYLLKTVKSHKSEVISEQTENKVVIPAKPVPAGRRQGAEIQGEVEYDTIYDSMTKTLRPCEKSVLSFSSDSGLMTCDSSSPDSGLLTLDFLTPTRITYDSRLTLDLEFHILMRQLLRRLSLLYYFHCDGDPSAWDFKGIIERAKEVKTMKRDLRWYDWERYSARQDERLKMGGFIGEITFEGDIAPFLPLIEAGEVLHVGKGTGFGLGRFKIENTMSVNTGK